MQFSFGLKFMACGEDVKLSVFENMGQKQTSKIAFIFLQDHVPQAS